MNLAIIPARGGSKRIPRKNIKAFCGKPIIAYSIEVALSSGCFDRVIVSTDDQEIADVALQYGAEIPFMRPAELSDDFTGTQAVIEHTINLYQELTKQNVKLACCIYATAPFIQPQDLQKGLQCLQEEAADFTFSVTNYAFPIQRALRVNASGRIEMFNPENFHIRSQDLEEAWHDAGQFYWGTREAWLSGKPVFGDYAVPIKLPLSRVQDIDTIEDWKRAEWMFSAWQKEKLTLNYL
ncbi:N-acylneuraminate cytidylyltransferase [Allopseudospirillum japonicum]|uniref:N-acylneuraminate cytidylyltransferase n=1 Tax=Allopseudospirillum japonicum TaxID=64971 RepID=A0A1H6UFV7_9GAMM|nr:pseudaminic acid cytidylyltransferase [Allopseudospirillum japonicum]SEI86702.1 N-acylneuraminate cytidylyltransferase [Allopseudospirillum japonicum]